MANYAADNRNAVKQVVNTFLVCLHFAKEFIFRFYTQKIYFTMIAVIFHLIL